LSSNSEARKAILCIVFPAIVIVFSNPETTFEPKAVDNISTSYQDPSHHQGLRVCYETTNSARSLTLQVDRDVVCLQKPSKAPFMERIDPRITVS